MNRASPIFFLFLLAACSDTRTPAAPTAERADNAVEAQVAGDMTSVRLRIAEQRIAALERKVGELENKPEKLDLTLLTQRLEQVEARVYAKGAAPAPAREQPEPQSTPSPAPGRFNPFGL